MEPPSPASSTPRSLSPLPLSPSKPIINHINGKKRRKRSNLCRFCADRWNHTENINARPQHQPPRIRNSSSSVRHKKSGWWYLGNEESYRRSPGVETAMISRAFHNMFFFVIATKFYFGTENALEPWYGFSNLCALLIGPDAKAAKLLKLTDFIKTCKRLFEVTCPSVQSKYVSHTLLTLSF